MSRHGESCADGVHGMDMIMEAASKGEPFIVMTGGKVEEVDFCGRANLAGWGRYFAVIGEAVARMVKDQPPGDCKTCEAQAVAVLAGYAVYRAALDARGTLPPC